MTVIRVNQSVTQDLEQVARRNRDQFHKHEIYCVNLMSAPGAGKTTLLEKTAQILRNQVRIGIIAGDIETRRDADRIATQGVRVVQVNTGGACHLDARMIEPALEALELESLDLVIIENVGNLVCPAEFDLGEHDKVMILSVTEGDDKPAKYPLMFQQARLMILGKADLLPYVNFSEERAIRDARALNPGLEVLKLSAVTGEGLDKWLDWLLSRRKHVFGR